MARKRLRHLSGSSTGSSSSSIAGAPTKVLRPNSLPPSPPPVFYSDNGPAIQRHSSGFSRPQGVSAQTEASAKDPTCSNARDKNKNRVSAVGGPPPGKAKKTPAAASLTDIVPPPAPQRHPRVRKKDETRAANAPNPAGPRSSSPTPSTSAAPTPFTSDAATPSTSAAAASQDCDAAATNLPSDDDEGFTLVSKKKKAKKGRTTGGAENNNRPSENSPLPEPRPSPAPRTSLAPRQDSARRPTPAPRRARPSVGVTRPQAPASEFPAFRVPAQEGYGTSYDAVAALEEKYPFLTMRNMIGKDESSVLIPLNQASFDALEAAASNPGEIVTLIKLDPKTELNKGVVMGYPLRMPVSLLKRHPQIEEATRCVSSRLQEETKQVVITVRGPLPPQVDMGNWGIFYTRPYTPEPLRCFKCQRFGHHQAKCSRPPVCGICSARHPTQQCLDKYKAKTEVMHKCPNCGQGHHAWNPNCPVRLQRVNSGREKQVQWVKDQQQSTLVPAPPGTFVWGDQRQNGSKAPQSPPQQEEFPPLLGPAAAPQAVAETTSAQRLPAATPTPPANTPPTPPQFRLPPGAIIMTKDVITQLCKCLSMAIFQATLTATGVTADFSAVEETCSTITETVIRQVMETPQGNTEETTAATVDSNATTPLPMASD